MAIPSLPTHPANHGVVRGKVNEVVDVVNALTTVAFADGERPGAASDLYASSLTNGEPDLSASIPADWISTGDRGLVVRLPGNTVIASRAYHAVEPGRAYRVRYVAQRRANTPDPAGDTVRFAIGWYNASYNWVDGSTVQDIDDLVTADLRTEVTVVLATASGEGIQIIAPASARFFRLFVQTFGVGSSTDVEVLDVQDVTDAGLWSPDVSAFNARLMSLESANLPERVEDIEESLDGPGVKTFITQSDAQADDVPATVSILRIFAKTLPDFPVDALYRLTSSADYDLETSDGKRWQVIGPRYDLAAFGVNGGNDPADDAKILRAFDRVRLGAALEIPNGSFRAPPGGVERSDIYVRGTKVPQVASDGAALVGGSRWLGRFAIDGDNLILEDFGADAGTTFLGGGAATDAINVRAADNFTSGAIRHNIRARNLVGLCKNNTSGVHAILMEGLDDFEFEGLKSHLGLFGTVVKGVNGTVKDTRASQYGQAGLTIKSDHYAPCSAIDVDGVRGNTTADADGLLAVHAATASLSRWTACGINALGGRRAVILIGSRRPADPMAPDPYDPGPPEVPGEFPYCALSDFTISDVVGLGFSFRGFETYGALFNGRIRGLQMLTTVGTGTIGLFTDEHTLDLDIEDVTFNGPSFNAAAIRLGGYFRARNITSLVGSMGTANGINRVYLGGDAAVSVIDPYFGTLTG